MRYLCDSSYFQCLTSSENRKACSMTTPQCTAPLGGDQFNLDNHSSFALYVCAKEVVRCYTAALSKLDLTYTQYVAMMVLWEQDGITVGELGSKLYLDSATLTPLLKRLEAHGYVRRERSKEDERAVIVTLTDEGRELRDKALEVPYCMSACIKMAPEDAIQLKSLLEKLLQSMG